MGIVVDVVRAAAETDAAPNTQAFAGSLGGLTPKAARFVMIAATTDGTAADGLIVSYGVVTGASNERCCGYHDQHGVGTTNVDGWFSTTECIRFDDQDGSTIASAEFSSFSANTVTINWTNEPSSAWLVTCTLYAGSDLSAHADSFSIGNSEDNTVDITDPGFEPDLVDVFWALGGVSAAEISFGYCHNDGASTITQRSVYWASREGVATGSAASRASALYCGMECNYTNANLDFGLDLDSFDANGFSAHARNNGGNNRVFGYLALSMGGVVDTAVITHAAPGSATSDSETGVGFKPQHISLIGTQHTAVETADSSAPSGSRGFGALISSAQFFNSFNIEDAAATTNTQSLSNDVAIELPDDDGSAGTTATFTSFDANGWTLNYTASPAAHLYFALAIEEEAVTAGDSFTLLTRIRNQRNSPLLRM